MSVRRWPRLLFFVCVYLIALLPVLQIVPILTLKNDRYLYFPMIGAAGAAAELISALMQGSSRLRNATVAAAVAACTLLGGATYFQSQIWENTITLWQFAIRRNPDNMLAWLMLAKGYTKLGNARDAMTAITNYNTLKSKYGPLRGWEGA
jgi:tetratricopeptide (TPR) repeat protein